MQNRRLKYYLLPCLFMGLFIVHGVDQIVGVIPEPEVTEKAPGIAPPKVKLSHLDAFPEPFEKYYNHIFNWRHVFVRLGSRFKVFAMQESPQPDKVLIGKNGWYFKSGVAADIYRGKLRFSQREVNHILDELNRRRRIIESHGAKYYITIPPIKHHIYPEHLPEALTLNRVRSSTNALLAAIAQDKRLNYIDLFQPLLEAKENYDTLIYQKTDHHWSEIGALVATGEILNRIKQDFPQVDLLDTADWRLDYEITEGWALAEVLGIEDVITESVPQFHKRTPFASRDTSTGYVRPQGFPKPYVVAKKTGDHEKPRIFIIRDSFASPVVKFLSEEFAYSFYLWDNWQHELNEEIFVKEDCDIYLQMIWEGLLVCLMEDPPDDWYF